MIIPAGPSTVGPLVTSEDYQAVTGSPAAPSNIVDVLAEAQLLVEQECTRTFSYGTYTERLYVDPTGFAYPSATPIDTAAQISPTSSTVQGAGIWVGYLTPIPDVMLWGGPIPPQTDVTYSGGYQPWGTSDGPTPQIPPKLRRIICKVAWFLLNPVTLTGLPSGATSTSTAGVSVAGDLSSMTAMDSQLCRDINGFRRRDPRAW